MRLFLSSDGFGTHADSLIKLLNGGKRVAFIDNAKDGIESGQRQAHVNEKKLEFESVGLNFEELDLRKYFSKQKQLAEKLKKFDLVWLSGGNTFILRRALAASGLDKILIERLKNDQFVYGGSSAGSIIPTPNLGGTEHGDNPYEIPKGYDKEIIWAGLNLVPFYIVPHWESEWFQQEAVKMALYMEINKFHYKTLRDGEAIVVSGKKTVLLK